MFDTRLNIGNKTFSYQYDTLNRLTRETYPNSDYIEYTYNTAGRRATLRLPSGHTQTYSYDTRRRLSSIVHSLGNKTFSYTYNSDNTLAYTFYPNLITNYFSYDNLYRLSTVNVKDDNQDSVYSIDYAYDANGNRTQAFWDSGTGVNTFKYKKYYTYDALNQMKSEKKMNQALTSRLYEYQYQFDAAGNRTQMKYFNGSTNTTTSYAHNNGNQLTLRSVGGAIYSYDYDANGNMTVAYDHKGEPQREFIWNCDDRLIAANKDGYGSASYVYDALGRRLVRTVGTTSTFYYYDGLTVIAEKQKVGAGNWDWQRIFTVAPGVIGNIFRISEKSGANWTDAYYHYDAIGNVVLRTNGSGSVLESLDQEAYGNVKVGSQAGYHLTTKEYDSVPELYYFWQRWYDFSLGALSKRTNYPIYIESPLICSPLVRPNRVQNKVEQHVDVGGNWGAKPHCQS